MYWKHHNGQLFIEDFHVPFGGTLGSDYRWVIFSSLMPWEEREETYALIQSYDWRPCQAGTAGVWCEQIHENAYLQFGFSFASYSSKAPF
jgi:IS5 family transposase